MTNRPIPRRGLLGAWFLTDRGITYDAGANEAIDRSGRGNHATYQNGVTVGVEGDPSRDFGAAAFDASSNQFADVGDPLAVDGPQAVAAVLKIDVLDASFRDVVINSLNGTGFIFGLTSNDDFGFRIHDNTNTRVASVTEVNTDTYFSSVGFFDGEQVGIYKGDKLRDTSAVSSVAPSTGSSLGIGANTALRTSRFDGEIAAVGRYDLTVPDAPEPSEIARRWDRLTDIPATR